MNKRKKVGFQLFVFTSLILFFSFQNCGSERRYKGSSDLSSLSQNFKPKEVMVMLKSRNSFNQLNQMMQAQDVHLDNNWSSIGLSHWSWEKDLEVQEVIDSVMASTIAPQIAFMEPNYIINSPNPIGLTSFTLAQVLSSLPASGNGLTAAPIQIEAAQSGLSSGKPKPIVAVIDTGIDLSHSVFVDSNALWKNPNETVNGLDDDGNGLIDDVNGYDFVNGRGAPIDDDGHGTHCAGVVLGVTQDIFRRPLATAKIQIMALKFLNSTGGGGTSDAINAIMYAISKGANVMSNSWGGGQDSLSLEAAIAEAYRNGILFVVAAGNSTQNLDATPYFPASYKVPNVLAVGATTDADVLASFSNFGRGNVPISAPGVSILSTYKGNLFARLSGTSMATPFVAGVAALMSYEEPTMLAFQKREILREQSNTITGLTSSIEGGRRLNALNAVNVAKSATIQSTQPTYALRSPGSVESRDTLGGGCGRVSSGSDSDGTPLTAYAYLALFVLWFTMIIIRDQNTNKSTTL